jgi:hypothetical protein
MAAGSIVISLLMATGSFETDTKRAEKRLKELEKQAVAAGKVIGTTLVAGAVAAAVAFDQLVKGAADFQDLAEETGASAEGLASLAVAAGTAGVSMESLAAAGVKLTSNLVGVDDESSKAGAAIKALGLNLEDFKKLDTVGQMEALSKAFAQFKDGNEKTAVAVALFGKSGAEQLKVMKALEEQGGRTTILTAEQIRLADEYADKQAKATTELRLYAQAAATQMLPAFNAVTEAGKGFFAELVGIDDKSKQLGQNNGVANFAEGAATAFGFIVDAADGVIRVFQGVGLAIGGAGSAVAAAASGDFKAARAVLSELSADLERLANRQLFSDRLRAELDKARASAGGAAASSADTRPRLSFDGAEKAEKGAKKAKQSVDEVKKAIEELEQQLALFGQDETFAKAFKLEGLGATTAQIQEYRANLVKLEELKADEAIRKTIDALVQERDELGLTNEQLTIQRLLLQGASAEQINYATNILKATDAARAQKEAMDEGKRLYEQTRTPAEVLNIELARLNDLLQKGAIDWDTYSRAIFAAQDKFDGATKKSEETVDSFTKRFAENTQDILGQGLYDAMTGNFKNIGDAFAQMITRMVAEAAAADIARALFGDMVKGGSGGGFLGGLLSSASSLFGGSFAGGGDPPVGRLSLVGENGPELFVPRTAGTILPAAQTSALMRGGDTNHFSIAVSSNGYMDRAAEERASARIARGVSERQRRRSA